MSKEPWGRWTLYRGEMWDLPLAVIRCGPGKVTAAAAAQAAVQYLDPMVLLSFGVAGCPDPTVPLGSLIVASSVVDVALTQLGDLPVTIPTRFEPDVLLTRCLLSVPGTRSAPLLCWEGQVASPVRRPPVLEPSRTAAVDWESSAVAQVAQMWDLPWAAVKIISDHGEEERLRLLALAARRPLQWAGEVVRRACGKYVAERVSTQEVELPKELEHED
ncbi:MAG: hypothetical protein LJE95_14045 [Acidobacteria bacterium]|jgi:nucleoside phosphorylase|nr:hypothetical protein [Acidobacteriota bacterium]